VKVVVTGGSGFIGSRLVKSLAKADHTVTSLDIRDTKSTISDVDYIKADLTDYNEVEKAIRGADAVYHLAGVVLEGVRKDPFSGSERNVEITRNIVEACKRQNVTKILFASSFYVYDGIPERHIVNEETPLAVLNMELFGATKVFGESLLREYNRRYGTHYVILRYGSAYGFGECSNVILSFLSETQAGRPVEVWGEGKRTNQYTYVDDLVEGSILALDKDDEVYNLISPWDTSVRELAECLTRLYGMEVSFKRDKKEGTSMPYMSSRKATKELGWTPTPLLEGIRRMVTEINAAHGRAVLIERPTNNANFTQVQ